MDAVHQLLPAAVVFHHQPYGTVLVRDLLFELRDLSILVVRRLAHVGKVPTVQVIQVQQVGAVADDLVELRDLPPDEIPLAAADPRPLGRVVLHIGIDVLRAAIGQLAGVDQRFRRAPQDRQMLETDRPAGFALGKERQLLLIGGLISNY